MWDCLVNTSDYMNGFCGQCLAFIDLTKSTIGRTI